MGTSASRLCIIAAGGMSLVVGFILIYLIMLGLTLGHSIVSGLLVSLLFLKVGVVGFLVSVLPLLFGLNIKKSMLVIFSIFINVISEVAQGAILSSDKPDKIGDTIIVRHHEVPNTFLGFGDTVLIIIVSTTLFALFFNFLRRCKEPI